MCEQPINGYRRTKEGNVTYVANCGKCNQCKWAKVDDWVGRSLLEAMYSQWSIPITLTYRDQPDGSHKHITKHHFQTAIRTLRRAGHKVRYIASGEYGDLKARAHFHAILFGQTIGPPVEKIREREWVDWWPHGHVFADDHQATPKSIRYVAKYLMKEHGNQWFTCSKKPPIGDLGIRQIAMRSAQAGVLPSLRYMPDGGHPKGFYVLKRKSAENLHQYLHDEFALAGKNIDKAFDACPHEATIELFDKIARKENQSVKEYAEAARFEAEQYIATHKQRDAKTGHWVLPAEHEVRDHQGNPQTRDPSVRAENAARRRALKHGFRSNFQPEG